MRHTIMNIIAIALAIIAMLTFSSCQPKKEKDVKRIEVSHIHSIEATNAVSVIYTPGEETSVSIACDTNYIPLLDVYEKDGTLYAGLVSGSNVPVSGIKVKVTAPTVTGFHAENAANISCKDFDTDAPVEITTETAGQVIFSNLQCQTLRVNSSTASNVTVKTLQCDVLDATLSLAASNLYIGECKKISIRQGTSTSCCIQNLKCESGDKTVSTVREPYTTPEERRKMREQKNTSLETNAASEHPVKAATDSSATGTAKP